MIPLATSPVSVPSFTEDRGSYKFDPATGSTMTVSSWCTNDPCDRPQFAHGAVSININDVVDCIKVPEAGISVKLYAPTDLTEADLTTLFNAAKAQLTNLVGKCTN